MITKYKAIFNEVIEVEILKETAKQFTLNKNTYRDQPWREAKESSYYKYCDTYDEAVDFLIKLAQSKVNKCESELKRANIELEKTKSLLNKKGGE